MHFRLPDIIHIPEVMKIGSGNITFCLTFHYFSCLILGCLLCCSRLMSVFLFFAAFWLGICVEVDVNIITNPPAPMLLPLPTILSLIQVTVIRNQCAPKAGFGTV